MIPNVIVYILFDLFGKSNGIGIDIFEIKLEAAIKPIKIKIIIFGINGFISA